MRATFLRCCLLLLSFVLLTTGIRAQERIRPLELSTFFKGMEGTFVFLDAQSGELQAYDTSRATTRFIPASTFKIPHTLIILETGLAPDEDFSIAWDNKRNPAQDWWPNTWPKDQTLRSAYRNSVVWFYQETARHIGEHQMRAYLRAFDYGNMDIGGGIDQFWLGGNLRISPVEQVRFLRRVFSGEIRISVKTREILKDIMVLESENNYRLYGKTGTASITDTRALAWLVGFVERGNETYYYAMNIEGSRVWEDWPPQKRLELVREILVQLGIGTE